MIRAKSLERSVLSGFAVECYDNLVDLHIATVIILCKANILT